MNKFIEKKDKEEKKPFFSVNYSLSEEQFLAENFYHSNVDYGQLFSYSFSNAKNNLAEFYSQTGILSDTESEMMDNREAEATLLKVQYAQVMGGMNDISHKERRKFANWVTFNPALRELFHTSYAVTSDVDYSKTF